MMYLLLLITAIMAGCASMAHMPPRFLITRINNTPITEIALPNAEHCVVMLSRLQTVRKSAVSTCESKSVYLEYTVTMESKQQLGEVITGSARTMQGCLYFIKSFSAAGYTTQENCHKTTIEQNREPQI